jgi:fibronectin type 3 domain-containing protein
VKHQSHIRQVFTAGCVGIVLLLTCTKLGEDPVRNNPYDAGGDDWTINANPRLSITIDALPKWVDYDFAAGQGTVAGDIAFSDANEDRDTLRLVALIGIDSAKMDTAFAGLDSAFTFTKLSPGTRYFYRITLTDIWDSTDIVAGSLTTPQGTPPRQLQTFKVQDGGSYVTLSFIDSAAAGRYRIYRASAPQGPFIRVGDTTGFVSAYGRSYSRTYFPPDYKLYYYRVGTYNSNGESRTASIPGRLYVSDFQTPGNVTAVYLDSNVIEVSWNTNYSYSDTRFFIFRTDSLNGAYQLIDSVPAPGSGRASWRDSVTVIRLYAYKIAVFDTLGRGSQLSYAGNILLPSTPTTVHATDGLYNGRIDISWKGSPDAKRYLVYRAIDVDGPYNLIGTTTLTSLTDSVATTETYYYKITARDHINRESAMSPAETGYRARLSAPYFLSISQGTYADYIKFAWNSITAAAKYVIFRSETQNGLYLPIDTTTATSCIDSVKESGVNYYYKVAAIDAQGLAGPQSGSTYGYLSRLYAPSGVSASQGSYLDTIKVSWQKVTGAKGYYVYRDSVSDGAYTVIDTVDTIVCKDFSVTIPGKYYYYKISAYEANLREGTRSAYAAGWLRPFTAPKNITASNYLYPTHIQVTWDSVPFADGYTLYRAAKSTASSAFILRAQTASPVTTFSDSNVSVDTTYYYQVSAKKGAFVSPRSTSTVSGHLLSPPEAFEVTGIAGAIRGTWRPLPAAQGYHIYRSTDSTNLTLYGSFNPATYDLFTDTVTDTVRYYYQMTAFSLYAESKPTPIKSAKAVAK